MIITLIILIIIRIFYRACRGRHVTVKQFESEWYTIRAVMISILILSADESLAYGADFTKTEQFKQQMLVTVMPANSIANTREFRVVLLCDSQYLRTIGLQGFRRLMKDEVALFVFDEPEIVSFWMASVAYPIDIIFVGSDKKVTRVYRSCSPGSRDLYPSVRPVKWVIETAAGSEINVGDRIKIP